MKSALSTYAALLPDGTFRLAPTKQGAFKKVVEAGFRGEVVVEQAPLPHERARTNDGEAFSGLKERLKSAGLPLSLSKEEVMAVPLKEAVERLYRIFRFLRVEQIEKVPEGAGEALDEDYAEGAKKKTVRRVRDARGNFVYDKVQWVEGKIDAQTGKRKNRSAADYANALIGVNLKLVKGTTTPSSPYSEVTDRDAYLIGVNLFPADKLIEQGPDGFIARYGKMPYAQILKSILETGRVPEYVENFPSGVHQEVVRERTGLTPEQERNLENAFFVAKTGRPRKWTFCSGASASCKAACLVYAGQNTAAHKNDWKKAATAMALIADPVAYVRLMHEAILRGERSVRSEPVRTMRAAAKRGEHVTVTPKRFFVRLNLLSDIPWESMVPWLFKDFPGVQFYDYTKVLSRDPAAMGVSNYDLTYSYSGENFNGITKVLYGDKPRRAAVVFLGYMLEDGTGVRVRAPKPLGPAGYGYGLPKQTDLFAPEHLKGKPEGMLLVTNSDKHDARPLDPPNRQWPHSTISGLIFKSPGGGETLTKSRIKTAQAQADTAFVTPTLLVPATAKLDVELHEFRANPKGKRGLTARINGKRIVGILIAPESPRFEGPEGNAESGVG